MTSHQPYVPASTTLPELTPRALILGVLLGLIFSASSVYLALKIGLMVSSSIPIAILSITIFRALGRTSILENNIVQTTGSASDSVAAGVVFTVPAILLMGYDLDIGRVAILAAAGGLMGILMMIPLRRALIVKEHGTLIYPEGTACAEVLIAGEERGLQAKRVFQAFGVGFVYKFLMGGLKLWRDVPGKALGFYPGAAVSTEISPELLGVGYIIGPRIAGYLFAGGCFAYLVLAPAIKLVGSGLTEPFGFPAVKLIRDMSPGEIRASFIFYIGAGAVASAGIIALARALPTIVTSFAASWKDLRASRLGQAVTKLRTEDDLPISVTIGGSIVLAIVLTLLPQ
ncbi:MAG TPA: oligopeptide transporter, OPT family, partial [Gemmatimonadales bacterium]|nr:oligopeptide transporter, OPT family [Gemmatimonadales bacterium]